MSAFLKNRDHSADLMRGIGSVLVILGHSYFFKEFIFSFHMPLFVFVSGFFFRIEPLKRLAIEKTNRLLVPFIIYSLLSWLVFTILVLIRDPEDLFAQIAQLAYIAAGTGRNAIESYWMGNVPLWFLPFLFMTYMFHWCLMRATQNRWWHLVVLIGCGAVSYLLAGRNLSVPYQLDTVFMLYPFFYLGTHYPTYIRPKINRWSGLTTILVVVGLIALHGVLFSQNGLVETAANRPGKNTFLFYLAAVAAIGYVALLCNRIKYLPLLNYIGANSIIILIFSMPIQRLLVALGLPMWLGLETMPMLYSWAELVVVLLVCWGLNGLIIRYFPASIGVRPLIRFSKKLNRIVFLK